MPVPLFLDSSGLPQILSLDSGGNVLSNFKPFSYSDAFAVSDLNSTSPATTPLTITIPAVAGAVNVVTYAYCTFRVRPIVAVSVILATLTDSVRGILWSSYLNAFSNGGVDKQAMCKIDNVTLFGGVNSDIVFTYTGLNSNTFFVSMGVGGYSATF